MRNKRIDMAEYAKRMNNAELEKTNDIKNSFNSSYLRDQNFEINGKRMEKVNTDLNRSFRIGLFFSIALTYFSAALFVSHFVRIMANIVFLNEHNPFMFSGWLTVLPFAITGIVMTVLANRLFKKKCAVVLYITYIVYGIVGLLSFFGLWDDMSYRNGIQYIIGAILCAVSVVGLILCNRTYEALKELDYLVTQEGFPTFNSAMFYMHRSRFVRYREKWESQNRKQSSYSELEKPLENVIVTKPEDPNKMEGISAAEEDKEKWFINNKIMEQEYKEEAAENDYMGNLSADAHSLPENDSYYEQKADPRKRPL
ncbi:MAG: hypothetical protein ACI4XF_01950 [Oscillospiraceae bacterium]